MEIQKDSSEIVLNGKCLYTPGGAAREYAAVGCNFYRGCPYQCQYCYNRKGLTAKVMGVDHAVLEDEFTNISRRPKKYRMLSGEEYAYMRFLQEVEKWKDYLRKTGIFFSFSTDPLCDDAFDLTWQCAKYVTKEHGIPVKMLTKNAAFSAQQMLWFGMVPMERRQLMAFGFTLTGRDDWEPFASKNIERIRMMRVLHEMGFKTFASIEPIVDFESSYDMMAKSYRFCDQFLVGLMSKPPKDLYKAGSGISFVANKFFRDVYFLQQKHHLNIYWKESVRNSKFFNGVFDFFYCPKNEKTVCPVSRDWSLFTGKDIKI